MVSRLYVPRPVSWGVVLYGLVCPAGMRPLCARHVLRGSGVTSAGAAANMAGDALALVEQLDGALSDAGLDLLLQQPVRHRVVVALDVHVVIEPDPAQPPLGIDIRFARQAAERRPIELLEEPPPADAEPSHRPIVEIGEQHADRAVQLRQREEALVAQPRQDPAFDHLDRDFHFGLVAWLARPRRQDRRTVVAGEVLVSL